MGSMAAETLFLMGLSDGDHVIAPDDLYGGTHRLLSQIMRSWWYLAMSLVRMTDLESLQGAVRPNTRLL